MATALKSALKTIAKVVSPAPDVQWDHTIRSPYDIWPNLVAYYERHKAQGCDLAYLLSPLRLKCEIYTSDPEGNAHLIKPVKQPTYNGKDREQKLRLMRRLWMIHADFAYQESDLDRQLEPPQIVVEQYRDFILQGRDLDYIDPFLHNYLKEQLALRHPDEHIYEGYPPLEGPECVPHGHRFGAKGIRSLGITPDVRRTRLQKDAWPEGWSGGRPLPIPRWMTGDVSSWEKPVGSRWLERQFIFQYPRPAGLVKRPSLGLRRRMKSVLGAKESVKKGKEQANVKEAVLEADSAGSQNSDVANEEADERDAEDE